MYEYVITAGEGTMVELGVVEYFCDLEDIIWDELPAGADVLFSFCDDDCETGQ